MYLFDFRTLDMEKEIMPITEEWEVFKLCGLTGGSKEKWEDSHGVIAQQRGDGDQFIYKWFPRLLFDQEMKIGDHFTVTMKAELCPISSS